MAARRISAAFFLQPTPEVARALLGQRLVHVQRIGGRTQRIAGLITETEAYCGETDLACHARAGRTARTAPLYGPAGYTYVYFTYGNHWMLNFVTQPEGTPHAVLIRAVQPTEGLELIARRRKGRPARIWTDGPGKLAQAFGITGEHNRLSLTAREAIIFVERAKPVPDSLVRSGPRVGLGATPEPWLSQPWRYIADLPAAALPSNN
ncbi:MAG: DNA-3-methyladenine glycosylase [Anaerolineales bacterium]|nr:DNA-3-methyladenine glycosylase [Anaerolineales bacterium]MCW5839063.1 DNA-3-methyladenine glycosylase [Anaerolineales bacterium]